EGGPRSTGSSRRQTAAACGDLPSCAPPCRSRGRESSTGRCSALAAIPSRSSWLHCSREGGSVPYEKRHIKQRGTATPPACPLLLHWHRRPQRSDIRASFRFIVQANAPRTSRFHSR